MIQEDSLVAVVPDQVACEMQEDLVILQTATGVYFGLDPVAKRVWSLLSEPKRVGSIRDQLLDGFENLYSRSAHVPRGTGAQTPHSGVLCAVGLNLPAWRMPTAIC